MPQMPARAALRVRNLRKTYKDVVAVNGIDLEILSGECFGLLGPNGAGKTTTIEICEGLTEADSGEVHVLGLRWSSDAATYTPVREPAEPTNWPRIGYVSPYPKFPSGS